MRVVVALGGNALLKRGQSLTERNQRENVKVAARALAPLAREHSLIVTHGNGPQVGLLALEAAAFTGVEPYALDVLSAAGAAAVWGGGGTAAARPIRSAAPDALEKLKFAAGSMGPKVEAACDY